MRTEIEMLNAAGRTIRSYLDILLALEGRTRNCKLQAASRAYFKRLLAAEHTEFSAGKTKGTERILCFDEVNGNLLGVEYPTSENQNPPDISRIEYSSFNKLGEKRVPYEVQARHDRTVLVTAKVTDVSPIADVDPGLFVPPRNSEFWPECDDMQNAEMRSW
jgi:hypothetical protein